jgi:hypothetical protein
MEDAIKQIYPHTTDNDHEQLPITSQVYGSG